LTETLVTLAEIEAAAERIRAIAYRTPVIDVASGTSLPRGRPSGPPTLSLKCENLQPMGAFKIRGATNMLLRLGDAARGGVITFSSGNHGQAVALAAQMLGITAVVVMPETAPHVKVEGARKYGAEVLFAGTTLLDRQARAESEAASRGLTMVPPFDHPWIVAGAGTVGLEILEQRPDVSVVYVPMGGGGLVAGVSAAIKQRRPAVRVVGVEPEGAAKMSASRAAGRPVTLDRTASIADGLLALRPGDLTFAHVQAFVDDVVTVSEASIAASIRWLFREARVVAEPSGAVTMAAVLDAGGPTQPGAVAVVSGGNVSAEDYIGYLTT
jgi:threo-3-hydroxy-L-aspartate ammonia-lyase